MKTIKDFFRHHRAVIKTVLVFILTITVLTILMIGVREFRKIALQGETVFRGYNRLQRVEEYDDCRIYVDTETGIAYLKVFDGGGITVMYDKDGNIYRPNGWRDYD